MIPIEDQKVCEQCGVCNEISQFTTIEMCYTCADLIEKHVPNIASEFNRLLAENRKLKDDIEGLRLANSVMADLDD